LKKLGHQKPVALYMAMMILSGKLKKLGLEKLAQADLDAEASHRDKRNWVS
jgi:hypothetical protein